MAGVMMAGNGNVSFTPPQHGVWKICGNLIQRWWEVVQNTARRPKCNFGRHCAYPATATPPPKAPYWPWTPACCPKCQDLP